MARLSAFAALALAIAGSLGATAGAQSVAADEALTPGSPQDIRELQAALIFLGFSLQEIDGTYGPQTRRAVEAFEFTLGMGDEGILSEVERAVLHAEITAFSYEKFGYRLRGYWSPLPCAQDSGWQAGLWFEDLVWLYDANRRFALLETSPTRPLHVHDGVRSFTLTQPYFAAMNFGREVWFFPLHDRLLLVDQQSDKTEVVTLQRCADTLEAGPAADPSPLVLIHKDQTQESGDR